MKPYIRMYPVLLAQEQLRDIGAQSIARAGKKSRHPLRDLNRRARLPGKGKPVNPKELASHGIAVRAVPKPAWAERYSRR